MKLSICMMVKNEEKYLDKCLTSLQALRDAVSSELIIVDTGSTDNTVEIAKKYTDKVYFHEWNDNFSEMRNITINYANGEWILIIDGDEVFEEVDGIIKFLEWQENKKFASAAVKVKNLTKEDETSSYVVLPSPRLFKNDGYFHYEGAVHNDPTFKGICYSIDDVSIIHYGYISTDKELMERKFKRTSELLKKELEKKPNDIYYLFQLSVSYFMHGDYKEAMIEAEKSYSALKTSKNYKKYIYVYPQVAQAFIVNERFTDAEEVCNEGIKQEKEYVDLYFYLAQAQTSLEKYDEAIKAYEKYLYLAENYENLAVRLNLAITMHTLTTQDEAYYNMAVMYYKKENYKEAFEYALKISKFNYVERSYALFIELAIKLRKFNSLKQYYNNVLQNYREELQEPIIVKLEKFKSLLSRDEEIEIEKAFSYYEDSYSDLNKIRVAFKNQDNNIENMIQSFIEKIDFNLTHDFYGDIIYYLMNLKCPVEDLLYGISSENIAMYMEYLINKYKEFSYIILDYIKGRDIESFEQLVSNILLRRCLLLSDEINISREQYEEVFNDYVNNGIQYITMIYTPFVIENELTKEVKNEEDKFFIYICLAENVKEQNQKKYINYLRKAVNIYPYMKDGIEILLQGFNEEKTFISDEFEQYKLQIKDTIKALISNGDLNNAEALIEQYEQIVKDDVEIVLFKSEISLKEIQNSNYNMQ